MLETTFVVLSGALVLFAGPPYLLDMLKGKTKPQRMTWFILSLLGVVAFVSQWLAGATWSLVFSGLDIGGTLLVFLLSLKFGVGGMALYDKIALAITIVGVGVSLLVHSPVIAIISVIIAEMSGMSLTLIKVWREPRSETMSSWILFATAGVFGLLTIHTWTWGIALYPAYLVVANYSVPVVQFVRRNTYDTKNSAR